MTKRYTAQEAYKYWMTGDRGRPPFAVLFVDSSSGMVVQAVKGVDDVSFVLDVIGTDYDGTYVRAHFVEELQTLYVWVYERDFEPFDIAAAIRRIRAHLEGAEGDDSPDAT